MRDFKHYLQQNFFYCGINLILKYDGKDYSYNGDDEFDYHIELDFRTLEYLNQNPSDRRMIITMKYQNDFMVKPSKTKIKINETRFIQIKTIFENLAIQNER